MQLQNSSSKLDDGAIQSDLAENSQGTDSVAALQTWMVNQLCEQLSLDPQTIDVQEPLTRYGLDSIDAVTIVGELEDWLELELPSTLFWDYPTIEKSAQYLVEEFDIATALNNAEPATKPEPQKPTSEKASKGGWGGFWGKK